MKTQSKSVVASAVAALFAVAAFNVFAAEPVKAGGPSDKPGRALDEDTVKSQGASTKPGRALDDGTVTAPNKPKSYARAIDDGTVTAPNKPSHTPGDR
jgi:hypothetical protein